MSSVASEITVFYWGMLGRQAPIIRILEHTKTAYTHVSDPSQFPLGKFGAASGCFAPPALKNGDYLISQSTAATLYAGKLCNLEPANFDACKAMQHMSDIVDTFEGNLGNNNEHGPTLKTFLEGERWTSLMTNLENGIVGPFYFGAEPSCVDFFLAAHCDLRTMTLFNPLKEKYGVDPLSAFPKVNAIYTALSSTDQWKNPQYAGSLAYMGPVKAEFLDAYNA